jgi:hypothetical protein
MAGKEKYLVTLSGVEKDTLHLREALLVAVRQHVIEDDEGRTPSGASGNWASTMGSPSPAIRPTTPAAPAGVATPAASAPRALPPPASPIRPGIAKARVEMRWR